MADLEIRCSCGAVRGRAVGVEPRRVNRVVCHCSGCRTYAHVLGRPDELLDAYGGADVFQMAPRDLTIEAGREHLGCMRLTDPGALRWYARCCGTPIANTLPSLRVPFMAVHPDCVVWPEERERESVVGPVRARINGRWSKAEARRLGATRSALVLMLIHYAPRLLWWMVRGDGGRSPFFAPGTRRPAVMPERISAAMIPPSGAQEPHGPEPLP